MTTRLCTEAFKAIKAGNTQKHNELLLTEIDELSGKVDGHRLASFP